MRGVSLRFRLTPMTGTMVSSTRTETVTCMVLGSDRRACMAPLSALRLMAKMTCSRVTWPLTLPGVIGGCIIVFIPALGNFVVPAVLGGARTMMLGNLIEQQFLSARNWPFGATLSMLVMTAVLAILFLYVRYEARRGDDARGSR